jgi:hypothetical protein
VGKKRYPLERFIVIKLQVEGIHCWPECPIEEVSFLKHPHRHMFHIRLLKEVGHNDRDVEIIKLKREVQYYLLNEYGNEMGTCNFGRMSCEDIAEELIKKYKLHGCEVLEDNENGAMLLA